MRSLDRTTKALVLVASAALAVASGCVAAPDGALEDDADQLAGGDAVGEARAALDQGMGQSPLPAELPAPPPATTAPPVPPPPPYGQPIMQQPIMQQPAGCAPVPQQPAGCAPVPQQPIAQQPVGCAPVPQQPVGCAPVGCAPVGVPIGCAGIGCWGGRRAYYDDGFGSLPGGFLYGGNPLFGPLEAFPAFAAGFFGPLNCF